jgi:hypothetical protein
MAAMDEGLEPEAMLAIEGELVFTGASFTSLEATRVAGTSLAVAFPGQGSDMSASVDGTRVAAP